MTTEATTLTYEDHLRAYATAIREAREADDQLQEAERRAHHAQNDVEHARGALREYDMKRIAEILEAQG